MCNSGCSMSGFMVEQASFPGAHEGDLVIERPAQPELAPRPETAVLAVNRAEIDDDLVAVVGAAGLTTDPSYDPQFLGRVSLRWRPEIESLSLSDMARSSHGERLGFDLARFAPWTTEPKAAEVALDSQGDELRLDYQIPFTTSAGGGFDLNVAPRARVVSGDVLSGATAGAIVRLGRNLSEPRIGSENLGWHFFVGADAQALTWKLDRSLSVDRAVRVEDFQMVGDAQAGVAMDWAGGDLAFGVVHRELSYKGASAKERFAGVTYKVEW
ncbi:MAG: lipid A deacylase LpxR family protein [Caulobacterales bacterium]|nr:lipid A deacylase LpxR family protein [Caulobacterales bacterium]